MSQDIGDEYDTLLKQHKSGLITEDIVKARILNLRSKVRKPEDIKSEDIDFVLGAINEDSLEIFILEQKQAELHAKEQNGLNRKLEDQLNQTEQNLKKSVQTQNTLNLKNDELNLALFQEKKSKFELLESQKNNLDKIVKSKTFTHKSLVLLPFLSIYLIIYTLVWLYGWDKLEQWTWILSSIIPIFYIAYFFIKEREFSTEKIWQNINSKIQSQVYKQFDFDKVYFEKLQKEIKFLSGNPT